MDTRILLPSLAHGSACVCITTQNKGRGITECADYDCGGGGRYRGEDRRLL